MFKKILLIPSRETIDHPSARRALQFCTDASAVELKLFKPVYEPHLDGYLGHAEVFEKLRQRLVDERVADLEKLARAFRDRKCRCTAEAKWGSPLFQIVAGEVVRTGADLVIFSPADSDGMLSRSEWQLVTHIPAPVLIVKGKAEVPYRHIVAAVDPYHEHGKPLDLDLRILRAADTVRAHCRATLKIEHCYTPLSEITVHGYAELPLEAAEKALEAARKEALEALVEEANVHYESAELVAGKPAKIFAKHAAGGDAELIVIGAVSRGRVKEFFIGSTAERVLEEAHCDVLVVKPEGMELTVSV